MFSLIKHTHRQGTSIYLVDLPYTPSIEEAEKFIGEDYEPDRDEDVQVIAIDHVYSEKEFKEGVPDENLKRVYVPIQMDQKHLNLLRKQKQELVEKT